MRVLVVSPQNSLRKTLRSYLTACGCTEYWEARTAPEALALAVKHGAELDFILSDHARPELDGFAFLESLRRNASSPDVPVLLLASRSRFFLKRRRGPFEPDAVLRKPFREAALLEAIAQAKFRHASRRNRIAVLAAESALGPLRERVLATKGKFWKDVVGFSQATPFLAQMRSGEFDIGMVVVDAAWVRALEPRDLRRLRYSLRNGHRPVAVVCDRVGPAPLTHDFLLSTAFDGACWASSFRSAVARIRWGWRLAQLIKDAKTALQSRRCTRSEKLLKQAIKLDGQNAETFTMLGDVLRSQGSEKAARRSYLKARELNPQVPHLDRKIESLG